MGDDSAFREVYLHYFDAVADFLEVLTKSQADAEEITQDVFVALWEKRDRIDPSKNIRGYIYTYAHNAVLNYFKHKKVEGKYLQFAANDVRRYETSDDIVIARETELVIRIAVERMPAQRRRIFEMSRFEGVSNDDIALQLGISKNTVENHITTAVKDIRKVLSMLAFFLLS